MGNTKLTDAKRAKNDEFYTQFHDIQKEVDSYLEYDPDVFRGKAIFLPCDDPEWSNFTKFFAFNFERFGLKKLISTSYAHNSKKIDGRYQPTLFEIMNPQYDKVKTFENGKIFTLTHDTSGDGRIDVDDLEWRYLDGDGDFRSDEIKKIRDASDIIVTNPPFSLFRDFLAWVVEADKKFLLVGNINGITYKELFPLIQDDRLWLGVTNFNKGMYFQVPDDFVYADSYKFEREQNGVKVNRVPGVCWYTNIDHGRRHQPLPLMTMADNIKFSKHKEIRGRSYEQYENYDAINVPFTNSIPSDYEGIMGVPITFLDKYSPEQFEIVWQASGNTRASAPKEILERLKYQNHPEDRGGCSIVDGKRTYGRIFIKHKNPTT